MGEWVYKRCSKTQKFSTRKAFPTGQKEGRNGVVGGVWNIGILYWLDPMVFWIFPRKDLKDIKICG